MAISRRKTIATAIALFLILAMAVSIVALPVTNAQTTRKTYAFIGVTPNPVGVGQQVLIHLGITQQTAITQDSWTGLTVTVTRPDQTTETLGPFRTDATGGTGTTYTPSIEGTYKFQTHFPQQDYAGFGPITWLASDSEILELVVQAEPIEYYPGVPLPTEYWTRPINAQFFEWVPLTGNWLNTAGGFILPPVPKYHPGNDDAPETAHVLWTKPYAVGGLVGDVLGEFQYEMGDAYEGFFLGSIVINGILYYNQHKSVGGTAVEQEVVAVDLKTGEELWRRNWDNRRLAFGQVMFWDSFNYHGAFDYLYTTETIGVWPATTTNWHAYDAFTGRWEFTLTNVPSGANVRGPKGEIIRYQVNLAAGYMTMWNTTAIIGAYQGTNPNSPAFGSWQPQGKVINATGPTAVTPSTPLGLNGYQWNVSIQLGLPGSVMDYRYGDRVLGSTASGLFGAPVGQPITNWAISTKPGEEGRLLFNETWQVPAGNLLFSYTDASFEDGVFIISARENRKYYGFSLDTGKLLWETEPEEIYLSQYDKWYGPAIGYGKFFTGRQSGRVTCYDIKTGDILWTYDAVDKYAEILWSGNWPIGFHFIADGKVYVSYMEHSPINPTGRDAPFFCLDVETGEEVWSLNFAGTFWGGHAVIGDSTIAAYNAYDQLIYAIGKGPSATTVTASPEISVHGSSILVKGMVTDISPGTEQYVLRARFPHGVPAVADENMSAWMEYVYMQFPRPVDVVGVEVVVEVLDPNNNFYEVGRATSDSSGFFKLMFTPEVPGEYTIITSFAGSKSYYGSFAETAIGVEEAPAPTPEPTPTPASIADMYLVPSTIGIIVAIVVVGLVIVLMLRKR